MFPSTACTVSNDFAAEGTLSNPSTVLDLFEAQVRLRPRATALEVSNKRFTYESIAAQVNALAGRLRASGVTPGDVVAICLRRTENLVVSMLGVLKAGAAYLPLSPSDPALRLQQVITHARVRLVVTDAQSMTNLPQEAGPTLVFDDSSLEGNAQQIFEHTIEAPQGDDLAYVIYTSGTTGVPKGVAIKHAALLNIIADIRRRISFTEESSWLAVTTVAFDIAALELLLPLCYGGKVILASEGQVSVGRILAGMLRRKKPTVMQATPITWRILIESGWAGTANLTILCGGDRLDRELANSLVARSGSLWNLYGPTETTIWSTIEKLDLADDAVTIGQPVAETEVFILDDSLQPQTAGAIGEICIGGVGLARGYVNDPQLTARAFIHLQLPSRSVRVYRTGDLGRWNEHGKLEFFGRIDHQVKINGFRIELPEIETVARKLKGVADIAVLGVPGPNGQKRLFAFVVPETDHAATTSEVVAGLEGYLPRYMIPERFWLIDRLPVTQNGKRDVKALQQMVKDGKELAP